MPSLLDMLGPVLGGDTVKKMSAQLGTDEKKTENAMSTGLAAILGGLARNASKPEGAGALHAALAKGHDGSDLDDIAGFLGGKREADGQGILGHVFGGRRDTIEAGIGKASGLDKDSSSKLMAKLAPMVMGALGREQREKGLDANALAGFLGQQRQEVERAAPESASMLGKLFDQDGDGDFDLGDIAKAGLGKLFGRS